MVLERTLESPLDCREIKPVHPKGNQSWIFIGRTDAEAETPILWLPDAKNWLIGKDPDTGQDWREEEKGTTEDEMVGWHHWSINRSLDKLWVGNGQSNSFVTPWTVVRQALLSMGSPRHIYWSELPFLSPGIFLIQRSNPRLLHWQVDSLLLSHRGSTFSIYILNFGVPEDSVFGLFSSHVYTLTCHLHRITQIFTITPHLPPYTPHFLSNSALPPEFIISIS